MPTWILVALGIMYACWTLLEMSCFAAVVTNNRISYNAFGRKRLALWFVTTIFFISYLIFG